MWGLEVAGMGRGLHKLSAASAKTAGVGRHGDGGGLYLVVKSATARNYVLRYMLDGRSREMGLGSAFTVSLSEARASAAEARMQLDRGVDPLGKRLPKSAQRTAAFNAGVTFRDMALDYLATHTGAWKHPKHKEQWRRSLELYAFPVIGSRAVGEVNVDDLMLMLAPIWQLKHETARRVRMRVERILSAAIARGLRTAPNPAAWRDNLQHLLPAVQRQANVKHFAALDWRELPMFMGELRARGGVAARALEWIVLTASRSAEGRGACLFEVDASAMLWTIPPSRMKGARVHKVPLAPRAGEIVELMCPLASREGGLLFPGQGTGRPITDTALSAVLKRMRRAGTIHGFRSTFRDWVSETTDFSGEVAEMALAHAVANKVEAAYRRGDLLAKRRELMDAWAAFCCSV